MLPLRYLPNTNKGMESAKEDVKWFKSLGVEMVIGKVKGKNGDMIVIGYDGKDSKVVRRIVECNNK